MSDGSASFRRPTGRAPASPAGRSVGISASVALTGATKYTPRTMAPTMQASPSSSGKDVISHLDLHESAEPERPGGEQQHAQGKHCNADTAVQERIQIRPPERQQESGHEDRQADED